MYSHVDLQATRSARSLEPLRSFIERALSGISTAVANPGESTERPSADIRFRLAGHGKVIVCQQNVRELSTIRYNDNDKMRMIETFLLIEKRPEPGRNRRSPSLDSRASSRVIDSSLVYASSLGLQMYQYGLDSPSQPTGYTWLHQQLVVHI